jgi:hypothetical protein
MECVKFTCENSHVKIHLNPCHTHTQVIASRTRMCNSNQNDANHLRFIAPCVVVVVWSVPALLCASQCCKCDESSGFHFRALFLSFHERLHDLMLLLSVCMCCHVICTSYLLFKINRRIHACMINLSTLAVHFDRLSRWY